MRAAKACSDPHCPNLMPCPDHERKPWAGSTRREKTRSGWSQQRRAQLIIVKWQGICHLCGEAGATEVDHVEPLAEGGADSMDNLRPIHSECHKKKTAEEVQRARRKQDRA